jgi:CHASE2 domain-containing sensor protein
VNQLLRAAERGDKVTTSWSEPAETAWIFAWCALGVAIGFVVRKPIALLAVCCGVAATLVAICPPQA